MNNYTKPDIAFQPMAMATSVSGTCTQNRLQAAGECRVHISGFPEDWTVLTKGNCMFELEPGVNDQFCYHVPMGDTVVFES